MFERIGFRRPLVLVITRAEESERHEHDKKLIAAAPELLAALRALIDDPHDMRCMGGCATCDARDLLERLEGV